MWGIADHSAPVRRRAAWRALTGRLLLVAVSLVVALGGIELGFRVLKPQDPDFFNWEKIKYRRSTGSGPLWGHIPNSSSDSYTGVPVRINALGLRDHEIALPKPPGVFRIVALGDSVTFGFGVRLEDTYVKRLEARLNAAGHGRAPRFEVLNAGADGEGLPYYLDFLRTTGARLEADLVLLGLTMNDIDHYGVGAIPTAAPPGWSWTTARALNRLLLLHSHLYIYAYRSLKSLAYRVGILDINTTHAADFLALAPPSPLQAEAWRVTFEMLTELIERAQPRDVPLVLVSFPTEVQLSAQAIELFRRQLGVRLDDTERVLSGLPQRRLAEFARAHRLPFIDPLPRLRRDPSRPYFLRNKSISHDWIHLSGEGNEVVADEISRQLREHGLVPRG